MLKGLLSKVVGDPNERDVRKLQPFVEAINALEPEMERRSEAELRALSDRLRARLAAGETLDDLLAPAFAAAREAAKRTTDMRPFDVQLVGGIVLHQGKVAEMRTGEGKTLVATMPIYLNALLDRGVHLVTVNDYLARRDALWMGPVYHLLGLTVGLLQSGYEQPAYLYDPNYQRDPFPGLRPVPRREAYAAGVTYGTNNEFGFDYLRDNLALALERRVQRPLYYAIVDEVDNIFIDEARTPLIISGESDEPVEEYSQFAAIARKLEAGVHYELDEKERNVFLTDEGLHIVEAETGIENIYDEANYRYVHYMQQALKAQVLFLEGRDYIRQRKRIVLVDQHTGRLMPDRRLSEGLHQAIEAKEGLPIRPRDVTSATITIQNYFRMYEKLAGMSGTAATESEEFYKIYKLDVTVIPTNKAMIRADQADVVYRSEEAKLRAVAREILASHGRGQPVLVGTTSVEMSERLSVRLSGERLQMAALAPRVAYALQDADLAREERASLREIMNASLETMNSAAWRRLVRTLNLDPNGLAEENLVWIADYLQLAKEPAGMRVLERALREGIPHQVLNAKEHTREAAIIARAGEPGTVTIATNMAGRGVDIKLGGDLSDDDFHRAHQALAARGLDPFKATPAQMDSAIAEVSPGYAKRRDQVLAAGGLQILGTERHEARRIDNQLRGRSGRQGEPGSSRFYLSLEDDLMRRFGRREMLSKLMEQIGEDFPIEHSLVSKTIERAQTSVEGYNFDIRKHLLEYDDVLNRQRESIYGERLRILQSEDLRPEVWRMLEAQVDEYLAKSGKDPDAAAQQFLFAGLDDLMPLTLPAPTAPFQGPVSFGGSTRSLTAFPPFSISFLADQLADRPLPDVRLALSDLARRAVADYGGQLLKTATEAGQAIMDHYEERLERYRALLDEKIEEYRGLSEERGQDFDLRRLAQHLERTYPLKLSTPNEALAAGFDDLREHWLLQIEAEYHRQTCLAWLERIKLRLPAEMQGNLDRLRPALMPVPKLAEEMQRVADLAARFLPHAGAAEASPAATANEIRLPVPQDPGPDQVLDFVSELKRRSELDCSRLDRLVGHVLGARVDDLLGQYLAERTVAEDQAAGGRLRRDLERLRASVDEGKKGGRPVQLLELIGQLNDLVHLEIRDIQTFLELAVEHEYDKWAQHQLLEVEAEAARNPLGDASWASIAEHLLAVHYTQRQAFDREHRRRAMWVPRVPLGLLAQAQIAGEALSVDDLRETILASIRWAVEQRESTWGQQELRRWSRLTLKDLDEKTYDSLLLFGGERELADQRELEVEALPPALYDHLRFVLALRQVGAAAGQEARLSDLPQSDRILGRLGEMREAEILDRPIALLDADLQGRIMDALRQAGQLDDRASRDRLAERPFREWDRRTRDEVAALWGRQFLAAHEAQPLVALDPPARDRAVAYLQKQRRFVDEQKIQRFLVHQRLTDLPLDIRRAALLELARARLARLSQRKIANLDLGTRQAVTQSLQARGLFSDPTRLERLRSQRLADLEPRVRDGFSAYLGRQQLGDRCLQELDPAADGALSFQAVLGLLKQDGVLISRERREGLNAQRLGDLDKGLAAEIKNRLTEQLAADLAGKTMEQLPPETRRQVHQVLDQHNYFVDAEKVGWYERRTLAQLPSELLASLEPHLGRTRLAEWDRILFHDLPPETRESLLAFLDSEGLLADRALRLRLTQAGRLSELPEATLEQVARHLGRQWLVEIRDRRPPDLPPRERAEVWAFLRGRGVFSDEFKEELFQYQRLDEFDPEIQRQVQSTLAAQMGSALDTRVIGALPSEVQAEIAARLSQADYFVDRARMEQVLTVPPQALPADLSEALALAVGRRHITAADLDARPVGDLPEDLQRALGQYLDETGYYVDEVKKSQIMDRRLIDLGGDLLEQVAADLAHYLEAEIAEQPVSDLTEELRQGLREALEGLGFFESEAERQKALQGLAGELARDDQDALAVQFGLMRLEEVAGKSLAEFAEPDRAAVLAHLQARDWFLDRARADQLKSQPLRDLAAALPQGLVVTLSRDSVQALRHKRLGELDRNQRQIVREALYEQGLLLEENQMRLLRRQKVGDLDPQVFSDLARELGSRLISSWGDTPFGNLDQEQQAVLSAYLGRRILGRIEKQVLLYTISRLWIDYLTDIEDLRRGISLEAYGQRDPLIEYKRRAFELFAELSDNIRRSVVRSLFRQPPEPLAGQASWG